MSRGSLPDSTAAKEGKGAMIETSAMGSINASPPGGNRRSGLFAFAGSAVSVPANNTRIGGTLACWGVCGTICGSGVPEPSGRTDEEILGSVSTVGAILTIFGSGESLSEAGTSIRRVSCASFVSLVDVRVNTTSVCCAKYAISTVGEVNIPAPTKGGELKFT